MLTIRLERMLFGENCNQFPVLVTKMVYLKVKRWVQDSSTAVVYIFHLAVNISLQNVIHIAPNVSLLFSLFY